MECHFLKIEDILINGINRIKVDFKYKKAPEIQNMY